MNKQFAALLYTIHSASDNKGNKCKHWAAEQDCCSRISPKRLSLDKAYRILEAPMRLLMAADIVEE